MLAYGYSLLYDHQGFRPFTPDHREAAGPVGPASQQQTALRYIVTIKQCLHELSRPPPRWLTRWSTDVKHYYSGTWRWVKPLIWAEGPPIGLYRTAVV